jgi:hypothetical protein
MRKLVAASGLLLIGAATATAAELPVRKAGLWQIMMSVAGRGGQSIEQCVDAATDQMLQSNAGPFAQGACTKRDIERSGGRMIVDSSCTVAGKTATAHTVITGDFNSAYTMTVTSRSDALRGTAMNMTLEAKWLGPCTAGQKPGDVIMPGGLKVNIRDLQKLWIGSAGVLPP